MFARAERGRVFGIVSPSNVWFVPEIEGFCCVEIEVSLCRIMQKVCCRLCELPLTVHFVSCTLFVYGCLNTLRPAFLFLDSFPRIQVCGNACALLTIW